MLSATALAALIPIIFLAGEVLYRATRLTMRFDRREALVFVGLLFLLSGSLVGSYLFFRF